MTDRQRQLIEAYLPHERDMELGDFEYYVLDTNDRVRKVKIRAILPHGDYITYGVYEVSSGRRIDAGWGSENIGFRKANLYDNKEDCKQQAHLMFDE